MFLEEPGARRTYKGRLVGAVLGGYLSLRRLLVQRTRLTDDTQEKLLELLEEMTTGESYRVLSQISLHFTLLSYGVKNVCRSVCCKSQ